MALTQAHVEGATRSSPAELPLALRRVLLLAPPLALAVLEIVHPQPDETAAALMDVATWFVAFHAIQLVLVGLVGLSVLLLADELGQAGTWKVRLGIGAFLVFYSAYDAVAGMGTGLAMRSARDLTPAQQEGAFALVRDWPALDPVVFALAVVGTLGWVVALGTLTFGARRAGAPRSTWISLGLAGVFLLGGHPFPFGTLAFGSLFVAALLVSRAGSERITG